MCEALNSVLAQTLADFEVIVIDDGSDDGTAAWANTVTDPRVRYVCQPHQGAGAARNHGVLLAKGRYLSFLDSDDVWLPDKLRLQTDLLSNHVELDMVFGAYVQFGEANAETQPLPGYSSGTLLIRAGSLARAGAFSTQWRMGEFIEWYARALEAGLREAMLPDVVLRRRVHSGNMTAQSPEAKRDYARILHAIWSRRKSQQGDALLPY